MSELKTLKDLTFRKLSPSKELRQEAIKYIKACENVNDPLWIELNQLFGDQIADNRDYFMMAILLRHLFNITEEDLK